MFHLNIINVLGMLCFFCPDFVNENFPNCAVPFKNVKKRYKFNQFVFIYFISAFNTWHRVYGGPLVPDPPCQIIISHHNCTKFGTHHIASLI